MTYESKIASELGVKPHQVQATIELLDGGATVPFISRYRKEATGTLDEVQVATIRDRIEQLRELDKRREAILKSIEEHLGTKEYPRMRIGIGKPTGGIDQIDWVLGTLSIDEQVIMAATADMACDAIEHWLAGDLAATMAKFNGLSVLPEAGE